MQIDLSHRTCHRMNCPQHQRTMAPSDPLIKEITHLKGKDNSYTLLTISSTSAMSHQGLHHPLLDVFGTTLQIQIPLGTLMSLPNI